jgi:hypothetical protein
VVYVYLDAIALKIRCAGKVGSTPVLAVVGVLADGTKQLLALELCGGESADAWQSFVDGLVARGLRAPLLCIIDGNPGLRRAVARGWPRAAVQRCCVKTQGSLPGDDATLLLLYSLVATGQITLRKLDGHEKIAAVICARVAPAA